MAQSNLIPNEILEAWPSLGYLRQTQADEFHAECPECGSTGHREGSGPPDRFFIKVEWGRPERTRGTCRRCGYTEFAVNKSRGSRPDPAEQARRQAEAEARTRALAAKRESARVQFAASHIWEQFHAGLDERTRTAWDHLGVPRDWQDFWQLGWTPQLWSYGAAFTIPFFTSSEMKVPQTLQYRLEQKIGDIRYRFHPDLGPAAFVARPEWGLAGRKVYVVEGAKKCMVTHVLGTRGQIQVVGFPMLNSDGGILEQLRTAEQVIYLMDPDAWHRPKDAPSDWAPWPVRFLHRTGPQARAVRLSMKIDDALVAGAESALSLEQRVRFAWRYD